MQATSSTQYDSTVKATVPDLERVREGVWALPMPMPYGTVSYSLSYLIRDAVGGVHVIDPGFDTVDNWGGLAFAIQRIGHSMADVASITITHLHPDHSGMALRLRKSSGAPIVMHRAEQRALDELAGRSPHHVDLDAWGVPADRRAEIEDVATAPTDNPAFTADRFVEEGDVLDVPGRELVVLHTPGHTTGSISIRQADESLLYTGDTVLPAIYPGLGLGGAGEANPIADYLASLERLAEFDDHEACPGHGYRFTGIEHRAKRTAAHHRKRTDEVERVLINRPGATVWEIASQLTWSAGWTNLHGFYVQSALAQTAMHMEFLRQSGRCPSSGR